MKVYSIFDEKADFFDSPFSCVRDEVAIRLFSSLVSDEHSMVFNHPEDFSLYVLADFDEKTGGISPLSRPEMIVNAKVIANALEQAHANRD